jgi:tripartite-type tricarboxylate transporter receptor subunit TctC
MNMRFADVAVTFAALTACACAQDYPAKSVRIVVGFSAGTATDTMARIIGAKLNDSWKVPVVVENREGAAGTISAGMAARASPDGYTLYIASTTLIVTPIFITNVPYNAFKDFAPISLMIDVPTVLVVSPQLTVRSVKDLIDLAKTSPGTLNYASTGKGTASHLAAELLKSMAGIRITEVPYKVNAQAMSDVSSKQIEMYYPNLILALPYIQNGRVRALAVTGTARSRAVPEIPAMAETVPGYEAANWYGLVAPAHTSAKVVAKINGEVTRILRMPDVHAGAPRSLRCRRDWGFARRSREADEVGLCEMGGLVSRGSREKQIITRSAAPAGFQFIER